MRQCDWFILDDSAATSELAVLEEGYWYSMIEVDAQGRLDRW